MKILSKKFAVLILASAMLAGCKSTEFIEVPTVKVVRDTIADTRIQRDSIYLADRVYIQGDTIYRDRWHYKERIKLDSVYITKTDTVNVPRIIYRDRQQSLPWHRRLFEGVGKVAVAIIAAWGLIYLLKRRYS